jgi:hypothetical protein
MTKEERKIYMKTYKQSPKYKAYEKAQRQTPEVKAYRKAYKQTPEYKVYRKASRLKKYGLTQNTYNEIYEYQDGKCAICNKHFDLLCVDHCHIKYQVRGLLCHKCNIAIGFFEDNKERLQRAITYLEG